jgi:hypothetical protein
MMMMNTRMKLVTTKKILILTTVMANQDIKEVQKPQPLVPGGHYWHPALT